MSRLNSLIVPEIKVKIMAESRPQVDSYAVQAGLKPLTGVKNVIAVASGKGGVGKSTVTANLALALQAEGAHVGVLDADIYGPSQPMMLGATERPAVQDNKMVPVERYGIQTMSIGYLVDEETPMVWRGPMVSMALQQMVNDTAWKDLDYLIIDLPPGTGDIQLTLAQKVPLSGAVIVTTPQDIALLDARRAIEMFNKVRVPILGVIENMSYHICSQCGHHDALFGEGGGERIAQQYQVNVLGQIPLVRQIREHVDQGRPTVAEDPEGDVSQAFRKTARNMMAQLSQQKKDYAAKFPKITIEKSE